MDDNRQTVLFVDDDEAVGQTLVARLEQWEPRSDALDSKRFEAIHVPSGEKALEFLANGFADVVLADLRMPGMDGLELLQRIQRDHPGMPVVMLTGMGSISVAVEAMKRGAADFIEKPWNYDELVASLKRAINTSPADQRDSRSHSPETRAALARLPTMEKALDVIRRAAQGVATVLIRGEPGTGKNVTARMLHELSPRASKQFAEVHCGGIPETLLESELFGHEPGSFTGAGPKKKQGRVSWAEGGTLFLDEVGEIPATVQAKLLQFLQKPHRYVPIGGDREMTADVRVVAATNRDLARMVKEEKFRADLHDRLNVIQVVIPPLRERRDEIEPLAVQFLERFSRESGKPRRFSREAIQALKQYRWPGNIRELENKVEGLSLLAPEETIGLEDVQQALAGSSGDGTGERIEGHALGPRMKTAEREVLIEALQITNNNRAQAARLLGISRRTLYYKLKEHGLEDWKPPK